MTTIKLAYEVTNEAAARVAAMLDDVAMTDPSWNGADFLIERDDFTCIAGEESYDAAALLSRVHAAISDDDGSGE